MPAASMLTEPALALNNWLGHWQSEPAAKMTGVLYHFGKNLPVLFI
jgi:hypothetical protein